MKKDTVKQVLAALFGPIVVVGLLAGTAAAQNLPPVCDADGPYAGAAADTMQFDGSGSFDPDGIIVAYYWDFGDFSTGTGQQPTHVYAVGGEYTVMLTVLDDSGEPASCSTQAIVESESDPPLPLTQDLSYYMTQVDMALPSYGSDLLTVADGPDWMSALTVEEVAAAVGDTPPNTIIQEGLLVLGYDEPDSTRYIKLDYERGYVRYFNRNRIYDVGSSPVAVPETQAASLSMNVASDLGIPGPEWGAHYIDTVIEVGFDDATKQETESEVERLVTLPREMANGYPVFGALTRVAVSNEGECARMLIRWPTFRLVPGLELRARPDVVSDAAQRIFEAQSDSAIGLGTEVEVNIEIGYADVGGGMLPVARVGYSDPEDRDAGAIEMVPLIETPTGVGLDQRPTVLALQARYDADRGVAVVEFSLPQPGRVKLTIYDLAGRRLRVLADDQFSADRHQIAWNLRDDRDQRVAAGLYLAKLKAGRRELVQKVLVIR